MKKILSIVLALCLCLTLLPTVALATGETITEIGSDGFASYLEGSSLKAGSYKLTDNITLTSTLTVTDTVTLDLNGKTLSGAKGSNGTVGSPGDKGGTAITVTSGGELTITDAGTTGSIVGGNGGIGVYCSNGGGGGAAITVEGGSLNVSGGRIVGGNGSNGSNGSVSGGSGGAGGNGLLIKGGTVSVDGSAAITGGTPGSGGNGIDGLDGAPGGVGGAGGNGLLIEDGSVSIDGGTFRGTNGANGGSGSTVGSGGTGGNGGSGLRIEGGSVNLGGGAFHGANCGSGGSGSTNGSNGAAGRDIFLSNESSITLTDDITLASTLICKDATLTLDLNGHVLSFAETKKLQLEETTAAPNTTVTLIDSNPTATHTDTTLPTGGVIKGDVLLTRGSSTATEPVTLHANGGTVTGTVTLCSTAKIDCTSNTPTVFTGNVADGYDIICTGEISGGIFYGTISGNTKIKSSASAITFMNDGTRYAFAVVESGAKAVAPTEPTRDDYVFDGWYTEESGGTKFDFENTTITSSITLYAKWEKIDDLAWLLPVLGALDKEPFDDVKTSDWFYDDVNYVNEYGLMTGTSNRTFSPDAPVTRGMVMTILARREGIMTDRYSPWYAAGVEWTVVNGISDGTNPEAEITREELATMLYRYAKLKGYDLSGVSLAGYADAGSISTYAVSAMQWAVGSGLMNGSNGRLTPRDTATRAQLAAMLHRFFG